MARHRGSILSIAFITIVERLRARIQLVDEEMVADLGFAVVAGHKVNEAFIHHHCVRVYRLSWQGGDVEPIVSGRVIALACLRRRRSAREATQR